MNPALLLCLIVCPLAFLAAGSLFHFKQLFPALLFVTVGLWPLGIAGWQLIYFTKKDPNRLQRDQHNENMLAIKHQIAVKQGDKIVEVPVPDYLIENPQVEDQCNG